MEDTHHYVDFGGSIGVRDSRTSEDYSGQTNRTQTLKRRDHYGEAVTWESVGATNDTHGMINL